METKIRRSISFDSDIIERIEKYKGRLSRSMWINQMADIALTKIEKEARQS